MKLAIASRHNPRAEGTPTGRCFWALGEGLVALGHELDAVCWAPEQPREGIPSWCRWLPLPPEPWWRTRARALVRPRHDAARLEWSPEASDVAVAADPTSFPAVGGARRRAVVFHYLTKLDAAAVGRRLTPKDLQDLRFERAAARAAELPLAFSERVAAACGAEGVVPIAYPVPAAPLPVVEAPVAVLLANWTWPPNRPALRSLLAAWPSVRERVPGAVLRLAGWGLETTEARAGGGIELVGAVDRSVDALDGAAVLAFPCPPSSGPKVKVVEALAHGVPVVTTTAGAEGVDHGGGAEVADVAGFGDALAGVLADGERRARMAQLGRDAVVARHAPEAAAGALVKMLA